MSTIINFESTMVFILNGYLKSSEFDQKLKDSNN